MFEIDTEVICKWPNGEQRLVVFLGVAENGHARILWNEPVTSECRAVIGCDDVVPIDWLSKPE